MVNVTKVSVSGLYSKYCGNCGSSSNNVFSFTELTEAKRSELGIKENVKELCASCLGHFIRKGLFTLSIGKAAPVVTDEQTEERLRVNDDGEVSLTNAMGDTVEVSW